MFSSRPPPPFVMVDPHVRRKDDTPLPSSSCAGIVALIRAQEITVARDEKANSAIDGRPDTHAASLDRSPAASRDGAVVEERLDDGSASVLSPLERRMEAEMLRRNPLMDAKRTPNPSATMVVFRIPKEATDDDLRNFGARFGHVVCVRLVRNAVSGASRGYGFVQFSYTREMERAVRECADLTIVPRPKIRGRIVACEPEQSRINPAHVPARMVVTAAKLQQAAQVRQAAAAAAFTPTTTAIDGHEGTTRSAADAFLDHIDDVLADWT